MVAINPRTRQKRGVENLRKALSLKTLLRTPVKTLLTLLLILAASLAIFSRVSEYAVLLREMRQAASYYRGVGTLDTGVPYTGDTDDGYLGKYSYSQIRNYGEAAPPALPEELIEAFVALPQVSRTDRRYMTAGFSEEFLRLNSSSDPSYNYTARYVMEGTFVRSIKSPYLLNDDMDLIFTDSKRLAGSKELIVDGFPHITVERADIPSLPEGSTRSVRSIGGGGGPTRVVAVFSGNPFGQSFFNGLKEGSRYLLVGRWEPLYPQYRFLGDYDTMDEIPSFWELDGLPENYLETEEFAGVQKIIEITNSDLHTFDMVYTSDMTVIPRFSEQKMVIVDGRPLTPEDFGSNACVISQVFLKANGLKLGDTLTMGLGGKLLEQHGGMGAVAVTPERYSPAVSTAELEIVGVYMDTDALTERLSYLNWGYSANTLFVPSSLLPVEVPANHALKPGEFSFVIDDARDIDAFLKAAEPLAEEYGISLRFNDGGWAQVRKDMLSSAFMSLLTTVMFICAAAIALLMAVYLFIGRGKREYAIMRALGTPKGPAQGALVLRLGMLAAVAVPLGAALGLISTAQSANTALSNMAATVSAEYVPNTSLPLAAVIACAVGELAMLALFVLLSLFKLGRTPPLALLQGDAAAPRKPKQRAAVIHMSEVVPVGAPNILSPAAPAISGKGGSLGHVSRYIWLHIRRTKWKAVLSILLAALMPGAMGLFAVMQESYNKLFYSLEVKAFVTSIPSFAALRLSSSELVSNPYYLGKLEVMCDDTLSASMILTNNLSRYSTGKAVVNYKEGYNDSFFTSDGSAECIMGNVLADRLGLAAGDKVRLLSYNTYLFLEVLALSGEMEPEGVAYARKMQSEAYTIVGLVTGEGDVNLGMSIIAPTSRYAENLNGSPIILEQGEFPLADNSRAEELRAEVDTLVGQSAATSELVAYAMDTTELENTARLLHLLKLLFPLAVAAAVLTGILVPGLSILQASREAAIMRVLGTTRTRTCCMLAVEQLVLCLIGLAMAAAGLILYDAALFVGVGRMLALSGGLFLAGSSLSIVLACVAVTRHKALELLQTKE